MYKNLFLLFRIFQFKNKIREIQKSKERHLKMISGDYIHLFICSISGAIWPVYWLWAIVSFEAHLGVKKNPAWILSPTLFAVRTRVRAVIFQSYLSERMCHYGPIICVEPNKSCVNHRHTGQSGPCMCGQAAACSRNLAGEMLLCAAARVWLLVTMMRDFSQSDSNDAREPKRMIRCVYHSQSSR